MRNNKQDLLTVIRIDMSILKFDDNKMIEIFGKTYQQIEKLKYEEVNEIKIKLHKILKENK